MIPALTTKRLVLRPISLDDAPAAQHLFNDYEVVKYLDANNVPWPYPSNGMVDFYVNNLFPKLSTGKVMAWAVTEKESTAFIGSIELRIQDAPDNRGFWLGVPYQGKGYMSEVVAATTDYAFDVIGMPLLRLTNAVPNHASSKIKTKQGARLLEIIPATFVSGPADKEIWELTPDLWRTSPLKQR